jgi:hypothetical protein
VVHRYRICNSSSYIVAVTIPIFESSITFRRYGNDYETDQEQVIAGTSLVHAFHSFQMFDRCMRKFLCSVCCNEMLIRQLDSDSLQISLIQTFRQLRKKSIL